MSPADTNSILPAAASGARRRKPCAAVARVTTSSKDPADSTRVHDILLVAWIALIAADRVDLAGGSGGFLFTPFLALTPVVAASELWRRAVRGHRLVVPGQGTGFLAVIVALLCIVGASVLVSRETATSAARALLLAAQVGGTITVILAAWDRRNLSAVLDRGAVIGILLFAIVDVRQVAALLRVIPDSLHAGPVSLDVMPSTYGGIAPRLSGVVADQNRAGIVLLFYGWLVAARPGARARAGYLSLLGILMLATLSRSVAVAALAAMGIAVLEQRIRRMPSAALLVATLLLAGISATLLVSPRLRTGIENTLDPLTRRLSVDEGSSQVHLTVLERGVHEGTASLSRVALGLGYGSAYTVLQDVFPGSRYASFHSLYVTMFAECGVFALLLVVTLFAVPLVRGGHYRPLVAGAAVFNVFYQATNDPALWAILAMAWFTIPLVRAPPATITVS